MFLGVQQYLINHDLAAPHYTAIRTHHIAHRSKTFFLMGCDAGAGWSGDVDDRPDLSPPFPSALQSESYCFMAIFPSPSRSVKSSAPKGVNNKAKKHNMIGHCVPLSLDRYIYHDMLHRNRVSLLSLFSHFTLIQTHHIAQVAITFLVLTSSLYHNT